MKNFRIGFNKTGAAVYTSHLDVSRMFARALLRAEVDILYSEGFNPHPKMVFTPPVALGVESFAEFCDIKTGGAEYAEGIFARLKMVMPAGIVVKSVYPPLTALKEIACAEYKLEFELGGRTSESDLREFFAGGVSIEKKTKTKSEIIEINDYIKSAVFCSNGGTVTMNAMLEANSQKYLNPEYIVRAVFGKFGETDVKITKLRLYDDNGEIFT